MLRSLNASKERFFFRAWRKKKGQEEGKKRKTHTHKKKKKSLWEIGKNFLGWQFASYSHSREKLQYINKREKKRRKSTFESLLFLVKPLDISQRGSPRGLAGVEVADG